MQPRARSREEDEMATTNGASDGDIRRVPETFSLPDWPHNCWYAAAYDVEVKRELLARKIAERNLVMYRREDGQPVALENACWHRLMPLSHGNIEGDNVACGYHGLVFNSEGRCVFMPSQKTINPAARVRSYPVVERHRFVWVWPGDPALADPDKVPDLHWNDDPEWAGDGKVIHLECSYKLIVDNLMDLTHETFVHGASIGQRAIAVGVAPTGTGAPEGDRSQGVNGFVLNTMTPETERSCHYFWAFVRNYRLDDQRITTIIREGVSKVFGEDEVVLAAQQRAIDEHPDKQFYNLNIDGGAMWARRLIDKMIAEETDDERYRTSANEARAEYDTTTRV